MLGSSQQLLLLLQEQIDEQIRESAAAHAALAQQLQRSKLYLQEKTSWTGQGTDEATLAAMSPECAGLLHEVALVEAQYETIAIRLRDSKVCQPFGAAHANETHPHST